MATHPLFRHGGQAFSLSFAKRGGPRGRVGGWARHGAQADLTMKTIIAVTPCKTMLVFIIINYFGQQ